MPGNLLGSMHDIKKKKVARKIHKHGTERRGDERTAAAWLVERESSLLVMVDLSVLKGICSIVCQAFPLSASGLDTFGDPF